MNFVKKFALGTICAALLATTALTGCSSVNKDATLVNINSGEDKISLGLYNFAAKYQQAVYDIYYSAYFGDDMWTQDMGGSSGTMEDSVKTNVLDSLESYYLSRAHAADYGVELSDADKSAIDEAVKTFMSDNTARGINQFGATEDIVREYLELYFYYTKVNDAIREETELNVSDEEANQSTISYVKYSIAPTTAEGEEEPTPMSDEEKAEALASAELAAMDFASLADAENSEVRTYSYTTAGDSSEDTTLGETVINAAKALSEGEVSDVIEVADDAYYVVRMDKILDTDATSNKRLSLENSQKTNHYNEVMDGWKEAITWDVDETSLSQVKFKKTFGMNKDMEKAN